MKAADIITLLAVIAVTAGVTLLLDRYFGGGGGGQPVPRVVPSDNPRNTGGFWPGFVSTMVSNGKRGGATPNVAFN